MSGTFTLEQRARIAYCEALNEITPTWWYSLEETQLYMDPIMEATNLECLGINWSHNH